MKNQVGHGVADSAAAEARTCSVSARAERACSCVGRTPFVSMTERVADSFQHGKRLVSETESDQDSIRTSRPGQRKVWCRCPVHDAPTDNRARAPRTLFGLMKRGA